MRLVTRVMQRRSLIRGANIEITSLPWQASKQMKSDSCAARLQLALSSLALGTALIFAGCGAGQLASVSSSASAVRGIVHGGPNPVVGATVTLYSTGNTGYGSAATVLATAQTDSRGGFAFPTNTCVSGSQVYVTSSGGDPGSGSNPSYLLLAALGDCSTISGATSIWVSEASTVAAAYALRPFLSISGNVVNIGAPAANNSDHPACSGTGSTMTCTAGGLAHAFYNALAVDNSVSPTGSPAPNGVVYTVSPYNAGTSVPTALVNSLANIIEICVNSKGGQANDSSACGSLFTDATPPGSSAPTNTLQALMTIAQYPTQNVSNLFNLATPTGFYQPALAAAPPDWSLALVHSGITVAGTGTSFGSAKALAVDAGDNVYVASSTATKTLITGMTSYGEGNFVYSDSTYLAPRVLAADTGGNLFFSNNSTTATGSDVVEVSNGGTFEKAVAIGTPYYAYGVGVDRFNNVYVSNEYTASKLPSVYVLPAGGTVAAAAKAGGNQVVVGPYPHSLSIDPSGDVWSMADTTAASGGVFSTVLLSNGSFESATPSFSSTATVTEDATLANGYNVSFDSAGNAWVNNYTTLFEVPVTAKSQTTISGVTTVTPASIESAPAQELAIKGPNGAGTAVSSVAVTYSAIDGSNELYLTDYNGEYLWTFVPGASAGTFAALQPCAAPNRQTTCATGTARAVNSPLAIALDATGSIWIPNSSSDTVAQVLGLAAPVWPQLSYGHPGVSPQ